MKFTIITPCFNSAKTIRRTIDSVLSQTYDNYEYIIVDGASTDGTIGIIDEYKKKLGDKLKVISERDNGIYDAMNKGIREASGDYIGIINSDDWYEKEALSNVIEQYERLHCNNDGPFEELYYGILRFIENGKERRCAIYSHEFLEDTMINHPTVFVSRVVYEKYGLYDCEYKAVADYDYMLKLKRSECVAFNPIYKIQANFSIGGMTSSYTSVAEAMKVKKKYGIISNGKYVLTRVLLWLRKKIGFISNE